MTAVSLPTDFAAVFTPRPDEIATCRGATDMTEAEVEALARDALAELAKRLRREATAFDNDLGSDPEADAGTARLLREAAGAIDLVRRADDHYFAVDYTGCIHEAPDRETAIKWAEDFARTANGGAIGSERPEVAAAIGSLARHAAVPSEPGEAVGTKRAVDVMAACRVDGMGNIDDSGSYVALLVSNKDGPPIHYRISEGAAQLLISELDSLVGTHPAQQRG